MSLFDLKPISVVEAVCAILVTVVCLGLFHFRQIASGFPMKLLSRGLITSSAASWALGVIVSFGAVFFSVHMTDGEWLKVATYRPYVTSLYFVAVSASIGATADRFDLAMRLSPKLVSNNLAESDKVQLKSDYLKLMISFLLTLLFMLFTIAVFCKNVVASAKPNYEISSKDLLFVFLVNLVAFFVGYIVKVKIDQTLEVA